MASGLVDRSGEHRAAHTAAAEAGMGRGRPRLEPAGSSARKPGNEAQLQRRYHLTVGVRHHEEVRRVVVEGLERAQVGGDAVDAISALAGRAELVRMSTVR
jgi:hypothetical protein